MAAHREHQPKVGHVQLWCTAARAHDNPECRVYIDDVACGRFHEPIAVHSGRHNLCVRGDGWKSQKLTLQLAPGEKQDFEVRISRTSRSALAVFMFAVFVVMTALGWNRDEFFFGSLLFGVAAYLVCIRYAPFANLELVSVPAPGPKLLLNVETDGPILSYTARPHVYVDGKYVSNVEQLVLVPGRKHTISVGDWFVRSKPLEVVAPHDGGPVKLRYGSTGTGWVLVLAMLGSLALAVYAAWAWTRKDPEFWGSLFLFVIIGWVVCWLVALYFLRPYIQTLYLIHAEESLARRPLQESEDQP